MAGRPLARGVRSTMSKRPREVSEDCAAIGPQTAQITVRGQHTHVAFLSPIPPAEYIEAYKSITPEAPQQLLSIFLKQASHRMDCERADLHARIRIRSLGQWFGILFALTALIAGTIVAIWGSSAVAGIIFGTTIPFCAIIFVLGREPRNPPSPPQPKA